MGVLQFEGKREVTFPLVAAFQSLFASVRSDDCVVRLIKVLTEAGADLNQADENGQTLLWLCCSRDSFYSSDIVEFLVQQGVQVGGRVGKRGVRRVPLVTAIATGARTNTIRLLLENGADPNEVGSIRKHSTESGKDSERESGSESDSGYIDQTPLEAAEARGNLEVAADLLCWGARYRNFHAIGGVLGSKFAEKQIEESLQKGSLLLQAINRGDESLATGDPSLGERGRSE
uniref:Uncharacterized protein n=1 Tax=Chromera velia CCMP2878 TaxID=1169474 RepID=A0A0G4GQ83_9ALVE|mmetsp:Transcript_48031/g.94862  ORF Transcript_48031/g.94862 Transcript_48031/m.94862 type:complete len:232 (+) Transcript_48031:1279-1974(+)|eukprot:Cvel_720.t1-p1 / transcript=Cvel_720.t1 / gene=Cvel_720 / organism=Chromera_velia_CCMP2878 / gene_product=hypothetical protein / transcript_product=hypothetical protein / location=Cvel_scaffold22:133044-133736(-) / protein_length=231 / sequence_SO=supercontig / SO=protein_coding / is_pseudo=false